MSVRGRSFTGPKLIAGGGLLHIRIQFFSVAPRLYCYQGAWDSLAIGTEENYEIVRSTYLSPSLKHAYVSFSFHFSLSTLLSLLNITVELGWMIPAALTGRSKPTQKWTFNKLDSEPVVTDFSLGPLKIPNPLKPTFDVHQVAGETSCPLGFSRSVRLEFSCQQIPRHRRRVQKIVKWVSRCTMARRNCDGMASQLELHKYISWQLFLGRHASHVMITSRSFGLLRLIRLHTRCDSRPQCIYYQHAVSTPIPWGKYGAWTTHVWSQDVIGRCVSKNRVCTKTCRSGSAISHVS
jgi:hypothetical protein